MQKHVILWFTIITPAFNFYFSLPIAMVRAGELIKESWSTWLHVHSNLLSGIYTFYTELTNTQKCMNRNASQINEFFDGFNSLNQSRAVVFNQTRWSFLQFQYFEFFPWFNHKWDVIEIVKLWIPFIFGWILNCGLL